MPSTPSNKAVTTSSFYKSPEQTFMQQNSQRADSSKTKKRARIITPVQRPESDKADDVDSPNW